MPRVVSPFEDKLLRIVRGMFGAAPLDQALALIADRQPRPALLSRGCVELVAETLAKGCVLLLARSGGWRMERFLRDGKPRDGRLWERTPPADMPLKFSRHIMELSLWLASVRPDDAQHQIAFGDNQLTPADRLVLLVCYDAMRDSEFGESLRRVPAFASNGLIRFAFADDWANAPADPEMKPWFDGLGTILLESLGPWLTERWLAMEKRKSQIGEWKLLAAVGREQERVLTAFTKAAESASRLDLVRFQLSIAAALLPDNAAAEQYFGGLHGAGPMRLAERTEVFRKAVALPRHVLRLREIEQRARGIGYLDEGYPAAQQWLADWERLNGDVIAQRARDLCDRIEPLKVGA